VSASVACELPDGRHVRVAAEVRERLLCGVLVMDGIVVRQNPEVWSATAAVAAEYEASHAGCPPSQIAGLAEARSLYKSFGMDPSRHRPSSEALLRRVLKGKQLYRLNNLVDSCNLASLRFLLPIGMYDLSLIDGDVVIRAGLDGEEYPGIRKGPVHLAGRLGLFDQSGPFGSPTSDSARTATSESTTRMLAVIMATGDYGAPEMMARIDEFSALQERHCGAKISFNAVMGGPG